jgi:hypothetical protein
MPSSKVTTKASTKSTTKSSLGEHHEDFLRRAYEANISTAEPGTGENWEVVDKEAAKKVAQDEEDKAEWVLVGKLEAEKKRKRG